MFRKVLSQLIIAGLLLTMIVPNFALAAGGNSLADDFATKSSTSVVTKNKYEEDLLDVCYYPNNKSFYTIGHNGTMLVSSDGDTWSEVTDTSITESTNVDFVDMYCVSNQIAVVGTEQGTDKDYIFLKNNNDVFTKQELTEGGNANVVAVAISGSNIAVVTDTTYYYHSSDGGTTWNFDPLYISQNRVTAIAVDPTSGKFKTYINNSQSTLDSQVGRGAWTQGATSSNDITTVKNIYRNANEWQVLMNNGTASAEFLHRTDGSNPVRNTADYMLEAAYTEGSLASQSTNILVGWKYDTTAGFKMIIRSTLDPNYDRRNTNHKLFTFESNYFSQTNSWVGSGKLYGIDAGTISGGQKVYIAVGSDGTILKSTNGYKFDLVAQEIDATAQIKHLIANDDPNNSTPGQLVVVTEDNRVFYSNDRGATWVYAHKAVLSGQLASADYVNLGNTQRLYIGTNSNNGIANIHQMILPELEVTHYLSAFSISGVTTNSNGLVYYGANNPTSGFTKIISQNNNGGFGASDSTQSGNIQLMIGYGTNQNNKFAFNGSKTHVVSIPYGSSTYTIPAPNGSGSLNGAINKTYVAWAQGNDRQILMDASGYVRVFNDPTTTSAMYTDTLIHVGQGISSSANFNLNKLVFVNGLYAAQGKNGDVYTSMDGITWTLQSSLSSTDYVDIAKYNNSLLLLDKNNTLYEVELSYNPYDEGTYVQYPSGDIVIAPQQSGPYDGTQVGVNVITVDTTDDPNAAGVTPSYQWFKQDAQGVPQAITGATASTLDLSTLSAGVNRIHVEVTYNDATKVDQPQSKRSFGPYIYQIIIPNYEVDVTYSATSFSAVEGYATTDVTPITVTIENTGDKAISDLQISSSDTSIVEVGALSASQLAVGGSITAQLSLAPSKSKGTYSADITVSSTTGSISETNTITVNVTDVPNYVLSAQVDNTDIQLAHDYASANDAKATLTLNNTGNRDIETLTVTLSDTQNFELSSSPTRIEMGDTETIDITPKVTLQPGSTYHYDVTIQSEAGTITRSVTVTVEEAPRYDVTLTAVKTAVTISDDYTDVSSGELVVSINNTGNRDINDLTVDLQGADATSFTLSSVLPDLAVGESVSVTATPNANLPVNEYNATLSVTSLVYGINKSQALKLTVTDVPVYDLALSLSTDTLDLAHDYTTMDGTITATLQNNGNRDVAPVVSVSDSSILAVGTIPTSVAANMSDSFDMNVVEGAPAGTHVITLTITSEAGTLTKTITVDIEAAPVYQLDVTADRLTANLSYNYTNANAGKFVLTALNAGNQDLQNVTVVLSDTVNFTAGSIPTELAVGDNANVEVTPIAGLAAGTYSVTVTFRADQLTDQVVTLSVVVASAPRPRPDPDPSPDPSPSPSPVAPQPIVTENGKITIPAGVSGTTSYNNEVTLQIPANASAEELKITIDQLLDVSDLNQNGEQFASPVYEIVKNVSGNFSNPVTLTIKFNSSLVNEGQYAAIFYYDDAKKEWIEIGGEVNGDQIKAQVDHFAKFAVLVVDKESSSVIVASDFTDIAGHWASDKISQAVKLGFVNGYLDHTFRPNNTVTREEFAVMLTKALSMTDEGDSVEFTDSNLIGSWAKSAVAIASNAGIVNGYGNGSFAPKSSIKRTELAVMIARAAGLDLSEVVATSFTDDSSIPKWSKTAIATLEKLEIINGKANGQFDPQATATRAEAVTIILNLLTYLSK